jgi:hypothetical protein
MKLTQTVIDEVSGGENVGQADGEELAWIEGAPGLRLADQSEKGGIQPRL